MSTILQKQFFIKIIDLYMCVCVCVCVSDILYFIFGHFSWMHKVPINHINKC